MIDLLFIERIRDVVGEYPNRPAILFHGRLALTYQELWMLSGRIANGLQTHGAGPGTVVAISLGKTPDFVATLLACWRIRAAYLPVDPDLPAPRRREMLEDAAASLVVGEPDSSDVPTVSVEALKGFASSIIDDVVPESGDLAWVIFTSGSTGRPRGVAVTHWGYVNVIDAQRNAFRVNHQSRVLWFYGTSFDASLSDIGTALLSGAALCLEDPASVATAGSILDVIGDRKITHADLPPSILTLHPAEQIPDCLQMVIIGGEVCPPAVVCDWVSRVRVVNVYGPTEATICTSLCECTTDWDRPLLGQPIPHVTYRVVDEEMSPVVRGRSGELWIAGDCLAREYVARPDETTAKFVWHEGTRFYRTGDHVRLTEDGEYEFLGRIDRQVKVRGLRIEPEEIERAIQSFVGIQRCAVVSRKIRSDASRPQLVAFIECRDEISVNDLREHLLKSLPRQFLPTRFERISKLPVTASNKPDLASLETYLLDEPVTSAASNANSSSALAEPLLAIFRRVLQNETFGLHDDFLAFGGDSLSILAAAAAARATGIALPPGIILRERTLHRILAALASSPEGDVRTANWLRDDVRRVLRETRSDIGGHSPSATARHVRKRSEGVLLTGATGFLGSHVLAEWLRHSEDRVCCLIRDNNITSGLARLRRVLDQQQISLTASELARIIVVPGDISKPGFGLDESQRNQLAETVETVVHCAARVHVLDSYEAMRPDNLLGTVHVLQFVKQSRLKHLHYASTLSVFVGTDQNQGLLREDDNLANTGRVYGGYTQSKWAAEVLVREAGLPDELIDIYRFGLLTAGTTAGPAPEHDLLTMTIRGLAALGCVPARDEQLQVDITPVDYAARAMVHIAQTRKPNGHTSHAWHIANQSALPARELYSALASVEPGIEAVTREEFLARAEQSEREPSAAVLSLCRWLGSKEICEFERPLDLFQATGVRFEQTRTNAMLQHAGIACPSADRKLIESYVRRMLSVASSPLLADRSG